MRLRMSVHEETVLCVRVYAGGAEQEGPEGTGGDASGKDNGSAQANGSDMAQQAARAEARSDNFQLQVPPFLCFFAPAPVAARDPDPR